MVEKRRKQRTESHGRERDGAEREGKEKRKVPESLRTGHTFKASLSSCDPLPLLMPYSSYFLPLSSGPFNQCDHQSPHGPITLVVPPAWDKAFHTVSSRCFLFTYFTCVWLCHGIWHPCGDQRTDNLLESVFSFYYVGFGVEGELKSSGLAASVSILSAILLAPCSN